MPFGESKACGGEGSLSQKIPLVKLPELTKKVKKSLDKAPIRCYNKDTKGEGNRSPERRRCAMTPKPRAGWALKPPPRNRKATHHRS